MKVFIRFLSLLFVACIANSCFIDGEITSFGITFFIMIGLIALFAIILAINDDKYEKKQEAEKQSKEAADKLEDDSIISELTQTHGRPQKVIQFSDNRVKTSFMVFPQTKNIYANTQIVPFQQLSGCEVIDESGTRYHLTSEAIIGNNGKIIGRSIAGGLIAGSTGAIIGGLSADKGSNKPTSYQTTTHHYYALINLSDLNNPIIKVDCGEDGREKADEIRAIVLNIAAKYNQTSSISIADELNKLAALKEQGIISQAEFDKLKEKLL